MAKEKVVDVPMLFAGKEDCCGCGSCAAACPQQTIEMVNDESGFVFPRIHENACIGCHTCVRACGLHKKLGQQTEGPWYAVAGRGDVTRSASAGAFVSLASEVIAGGGSVFGAAYELRDDGLRVRHRIASDAEGLTLLQNSKYVQSAAGSCFSDIRHELKAGRAVFFCGTPCQVAGLRGFLGTELELSNLYTADLVCHGVPSEQMFRDWVASEEARFGKKVVDVRFRCKRDGWGHSLLLILLEDGSEKFVPANRSAYYAMFLGLETLRDSCYVCPYASGYRAGDLTLGDFWGIQNSRPDVMEDAAMFNQQRGVSCLLVNNVHGREALERFGKQLALVKVGFNDIAMGNDQLRHASVLPDDRDACLAAYRKGGWDGVARWWRWHHDVPSKMKVGVKTAVKRVLPESAVKCLRRMWGCT